MGAFDAEAVIEGDPEADVETEGETAILPAKL